jgi:hypothetical protein
MSRFPSGSVSGRPGSLQEADPIWGQAQAQLQEAVKGSKGGQIGNQNASKNDAPRCGAVKDPTTSDSNRHPTDRKSRLIRTLTNLKEDAEACRSKGTTPEKVQEAQTSDPATTSTPTESEL